MLLAQGREEGEGVCVCVCDAHVTTCRCVLSMLVHVDNCPGWA